MLVIDTDHSHVPAHKDLICLPKYLKTTTLIKLIHWSGEDPWQNIVKRGRENPC